MSRTLKLIFTGFLFACFTLIGTASTQAKQDKIKPEAELTSGTPLSPSDKKHLLEDNFVVVRTVSAIPSAVRNELLGKRTEAGMADAGQPYQVGDVIIGPRRLPFRRLIFAGTSSGYCFVYDEYGGFVAGQEVYLCQYSSQGEAVLIWHAHLQNGRNYLSLAQMRSKISDGKFFSRHLPQVH